MVTLASNPTGSQSGGGGGGGSHHSGGPQLGSMYEQHNKAPPGGQPPQTSNQHGSQYSMQHNQSSQPTQTQPQPSHQTGNYSMPYQATPGSNVPANNYYHSQSKPLNQSYQAQQYSQPYGSVNSGHNQSAPPSQQQQQQKSTLQQSSSNQQSHQVPPPFPDLAKVQQAVVVAAQLAQYYPPNQGAPGSGVTGPPAGPNSHSSGQMPPMNNQSPAGHGQPATGSYGQIQYTSTPGI